MEREEQIQIVNSWLQDLSSVLEVKLSLDNEGVCTFQIGENLISLEVSSDFPMVHIYSPLLALSAEDKDSNTALLVKALELNAFQVLTRGGAIAAVPGGGFLIYCYSIPIPNTNSEQFSSALETFFETIPEIKSLLIEPSDIIPKAEKMTPGFLKI